MTEDQARTKWCPHVRETEQEMGTFNRWNTFKQPGAKAVEPIDTGQLNPDCCCIASDCMMWRWRSTQSGYCGLAALENAGPPEW